MSKADPDESFSPEETARRRDAVLKIMVNTPPQPHATRPPAQPRKRKPSGVGQSVKGGARQQKP
jgi:hypothetical protein